MKKSLIFIIIIIVAAGIVFFSLFWPIDDENNLKGTIGGVEKAEKYRGEQLDETDLLLENENFAALTQSAEWQNAMKNEEVVKFLQSDDFSKYISLTSQMQVFAVYSQCFQSLYSILQEESDLTPEKVYSILQSDDFQKVVMSQDLVNDNPTLVLQDFQKFVVLWDIETIKTILFSNDLNLVEYNVALQNLYENADFKAVYSQDFQNTIMTQDFQSIIAFMSKDFQKFLSQDFQKQFMSQDFQKFLSQDFQKFLSQDFQKQFMSLDIQNIIGNKNFQSLFYGDSISPNLVPVLMQDFQKCLKDGEFI